MTDEALEARYRSVRERFEAALMNAGRPADSAELIAVSKTHPFEKIEALYRLGQRDFGENYVQELVEKAQMAETRGLSEIRWHMIGHLQTNKVKQLLPYVSMIHSLDSKKLAFEIEKRAERPVPVTVEINLDAQGSKSGVSIDALPELVSELATLRKVEAFGLMCIPNPERAGGAADAFRTLRSLESRFHPPFRGILSMGMTADFELALANGATHVRVGTAIFGAR